MRMVEPIAVEAIEATPRKRLSAAERAAILERQEDRCGRCRESLIWSLVEGKPVYGPMVDEHIIPLELGGANDLSNRELLCVGCAKQKTRADRKAIAKVARIGRRLAGAKPLKQKIRSRGFQRDPLHWRSAEEA